MYKAEDIVMGLLAATLGFMLLGLGALGIYRFVGTYNERVECQKLGIPLYRCQSNSIQADVKVDQ